MFVSIILQFSASIFSSFLESVKLCLVQSVKFWFAVFCSVLSHHHYDHVPLLYFIFQSVVFNLDIPNLLLKKSWSMLLSCNKSTNWSIKDKGNFILLFNRTLVAKLWKWEKYASRAFKKCSNNTAIIIFN